MGSATSPYTRLKRIPILFEISFKLIRALQHRCWAEIDLSAFERNLKRLQATLPAEIRYMSVVKADSTNLWFLTVPTTKKN